MKRSPAAVAAVADDLAQGEAEGGGQEQDGEEGVEVWVDLELKVVADVEIIGVPNAGKSTLLSVITAGETKVWGEIGKSR